MAQGPRKGEMKRSAKAKTTASGKGIIYSNPSGDKALENVYKKLQKNPKALDKSGMGIHTHIPKA